MNESLLSQQPKSALRIDLLVLTETLKRTLNKVGTHDILVSSTRRLHPDGIYSPEIFGAVGSPERMTTESYIHLKTPIIQPIFYKNMIKASAFYREIMSGKAYATFNKETKLFESSAPVEGKTGFHFFLSHFDQLEFPATDSIARDTLIGLKQKKGDKLILTDFLVIPAGVRDIMLDEQGRVVSEEEISVLYGELIQLTNYINDGYKNTPESYDGVAFRIQEKAMEVYDYLYGITFDGKKKFALGKWGSRNIAYGTRGILGTLVTNDTVLGGELMVKPDETVVGLYQYIMAIMPLTIYHIRRKLLDRIFDQDRLQGYLFDIKRQRYDWVLLEQQDIDLYTTRNGLESLINSFGMDAIRNEPIMIANKYYLCMLYKTDTSVMIVEHPDDLDGKMNGELVPMTYGELFYLSLYDHVGETAQEMVRYPAGALGGAYTSLISLATTIAPLQRDEVDNMGNVLGRMLNYPNTNESYFNSFAIHTTHLGRVGGDHDGDMGGVNAILTREGVEDVKAQRRKASFFIAPDGGLTFSLGNDATDLVIAHFTDPRRL